MKAEHSVHVACTAKLLMNVLCDFESYPDFLPRMKRARVLLHEGDSYEVDFALDFVRLLEYTLRLHRAPLVLEWTLVRGFFRNNRGSWTLEQREDGILATYRIDIQPQAFVPRAVMNSLLRHDLPDTLQRFKHRAESLTSALLHEGSAPGDG